MESIISSFTLADYIGIAIGIFGICWGFYTYRKAKKRPNQLKYISDKFFNIYKTLLSDKFNLDIKYKDKPITNNIFYMSGKLVVKGDIKTKGNEIFIRLPEGWKWIGTSKEQSHDDIKADFKVDDKSLDSAILTFDKLRREDYINISAIIEGEELSSEDKSTFQKKIRFSHRIDDTDCVVKFEDLKDLEERKLLIIFITILVIAIVFVIIAPEETFRKVGNVTIIGLLLLYITISIYFYIIKLIRKHQKK